MGELRRNLNGGICENCSKRVIHRHRVRVTSGACEDVLSFCRKCDEGGECDYCLPESALEYYEFIYLSSADDLGQEPMIVASFAIEFAEKYLDFCAQKSEEVRAADAH